MTKKQMRSLKSNYELAVKMYLVAFAEKQALTLEDRIGENLCFFGDTFYFDFFDIKLDIDNEIPKGVFLEWFDYALEEYREWNNCTDYKQWLIDNGHLKAE